MNEHEQSMAMRVAHFSDLHLLSLEGTSMFDFANKRWIGGLNLLTNRGRHYHSHIFEAMVEDINERAVDHIVCTGDLTNLAFEQEFKFARALFDRLAVGADEVTVVPGNHDTYVSAGSDYFRDVFAGYHRSDAGWHADGDGAHESLWPVVRVRGQGAGRVAFIGVSTSRPTPWFTAYGRIGAAQLDRLGEILADERMRGAMRVVALHHPPVGKAARNKVRGLRDWQAFGEVIAKHGAELVIHGHEHRDMRNQMAGPDGRAIDVLGVQAGTYMASKAHRIARYRIFEVSPAEAEAERPRLVRHTLRMWSDEQRGFVPDEDDGDAEVSAQVA